MSGRCSPTKALELLRPAFEPMDAAAELTRAVHKNRCRVYCDGVLVKPHIAAITRVVPKLADDGRWTADIESTGPGLGWARGLNWELEIDEVMALKPQPELERPWPTVTGSVNWSPPAMLAQREQAPTPEPEPEPEPPSSEIDRILDDLPRRPVGRLPQHNWRAIDAEIARRCIDPKTKRVRIPKSERRLARDMLNWCQRNYGKEPAESDMRASVGAVCEALRPLQK